MRVGDLLGGRYRLEKLLGQGGMGEVWEGFDLTLGRPVALKLLLQVDAGEESLQRFRREASIGARLQHPGITVVHDVGRHDDRLFIVMELLRGTDLERLLARSPGGLPIPEAVRLVAQAADALAAAHTRQVVHRDLKPGNLFLLSDGRLKLCDFGIARTAQATQGLTVPGRLFGTPAYMAPEQWRGEHVDARCDLYALGCVLYTLLTGRPPFPATEQAWSLMRRHLDEVPPPPSSIRAGVPAEIDRLVGALLAKDPALRPDAATVAATLSGGPATEPASLDRLRVPVPEPRDRRNRVAALVGAVVLITGAAVWAVAATRDDGRDGGTDAGGRSTATTTLTPSPTAGPTRSPSTTASTASSTAAAPPPSTPSGTTTTPEPADSTDSELTWQSLLPRTFTDSKGVLYNVRSGGSEPCVDGRESATVRSALTDNGCRGSVVGTYTDREEHILVVVTVAAMPDREAATAARADLTHATTGEWAMWCPQDGPAADVCDKPSSEINRATQTGYVGNSGRFLTHTTAMYVSLEQNDAVEPWLDAAALAASYAAGPQGG